LHSLDEPICLSYEVYREPENPMALKGMRHQNMEQVSKEIADKRVAVTPSTLADLWDLTTAGQSLGDTIAMLVEEHQRAKLESDLDEIDAVAHYTSWDQVKEELGL
jgi:hypothetical protein